MSIKAPRDFIALDASGATGTRPSAGAHGRTRKPRAKGHAAQAGFLALAEELEGLAEEIEEEICSTVS